MNFLTTFLLLLRGNYRADNQADIRRGSQIETYSPLIQAELDTPDNEQITLRQGIGNNQQPPGRRRISTDFTPSRIPALQTFRVPSSVNVGTTVIRNHLRFGQSRLVEGCDDFERRIPCNRYQQRVDRNQCNRWKCCWNPADPVPCAYNKYYFTRYQTEPTEFGTCGFPNSALDENNFPAPVPFLIALITQRIIGGTPAPPNEYPWMVYFYILQLGFPQGGICGGSLINSQWIVTAAHCFETPLASLFGVVLGEHDVTVSSGNEVFRTIENLFLHPDFGFAQRNNDIALVKMNLPVTETRNIRPICIIPQGTVIDSTIQPTLAGTGCISLGWGLTANGGSTSNVLLQLTQIITPRSACLDITNNNVGLYTNLAVFDSQPKFCAGGVENEDTCEGDSGGPLMCLNPEGFYELVGITSYGTSQCAQAGLPGVFTDVSVFGTFIETTIAANS